MDWLFSIYLVFLVAVIARYLWMLVGSWCAAGSPGAPDVTQASSGL